jgi:hypothetical protein
MIFNWNGKEEGLNKDTGKKSYMNSVSKGVIRSIYY